MLEREKGDLAMWRTHLFILALTASLLAAAGCGDSDSASEAIDKKIQTAAENVEDATDNAVDALGEAADNLGDVVEDAAEEVGKAIDNRGREKSNAK